MSVKTTSNTLITTKLHRPPLDRIHVHRPHLLERLDQRRSRPLTLVSAPAGYGKSVLISSWLESCDIPGAWVSLDENDNDLRTFTAYFVAAVEALFTGACRNTQALLSASDLPPIEVFVANLLNELVRIEQAFILVLDDFHLIEDESVLNLLRQLLSHPPQTMHLVLIGRQDPAVPVSTLRAQSFVTEIRSRDLRFNELETATFLKLLLGTQVDPATAAALQKKTEGWVTGLRLAVLSMRHRGGLDLKLLEPQVDAQYVMEYLFTEVFSRQPPEIRQYLLGTAILDRFADCLVTHIHDARCLAEAVDGALILYERQAIHDAVGIDQVGLGQGGARRHGDAGQRRHRRGRPARPSALRRIRQSRPRQRPHHGILPWSRPRRRPTRFQS